MAENKEYIEQFEDMAKEINTKTVEVYIDIPGLEVKYDVPIIGSKLKSNCSVMPTFNKFSLEVIAIVTRKDGSDDKYKYTLQKLPGEIIPEECSTKYSDGMITLVLKKAKPVASWEVQIEKGLRTLNE